MEGRREREGERERGGEREIEGQTLVRSLTPSPPHPLTPSLRYPFPWRVVLSLAPRAVTQEPTSLIQAAEQIVARMNPPPLIDGPEEIPKEGAFVLVANHYQRRGLWIGHAGSVITKTLYEVNRHDLPIRWVVTANLPTVRFLGREWTIPLTTWSLDRVAAIFSMISIPRIESQTLRRGLALRRLLQTLRTQAAGPPIGLFPEGVHGTADGLTRPEPGIGRLLFLIAGMEMPILPVGISEADQRLVVKFGRLIPPEEIEGMVEEDDIDQTVATYVMRRIAELLPHSLHGAYRSSINPLLHKNKSSP